MIERGNLNAAWKRVKSNKGAEGVDGLDIEGTAALIRREWDEIKARLTAGTYKPRPVRRVEIPKPNGGTRKLGVPTVSNGVQLADLCCYNVYRAFRSRDFSYPYFAKLLPHIYRSNRTPADKLDGLKVFPDDSELIVFAADSYRNWLKAQLAAKPANGGGLR